MSFDDNILGSMCEHFYWERSGQRCQYLVAGFLCDESYPDCIQIYNTPNNEILRRDDILISKNTGQRYIIDRIIPIPKMVDEYIVHYHFKEYDRPVSQTTYNFNAQINNSAIAQEQHHFVVNQQGISFDQLRQLINSPSVNPTDQNELTQMADELENVANSGEPIQQGFLSRFGDAMAKYGDIVAAVMQISYQIFTHKPTP